MITKKLFLTFGLLTGLVWPLASAQDAAAPRVEVNFIEPEKFTDLRDSFGQTGRVNEFYLRELRTHVERVAARRLPEGHRLIVAITDVDMAGDFEPWRSPQFHDVRIVKDIYPPRINLNFQVLDANGAVVSEGQRELRDLAFNMRTPSLPTNDPMRHEKALLDDWLRREFRTAKR
jgi:hypothetical protein